MGNSRTLRRYYS